MLDIGWSEMLVIGLVALLVIGPKELPGALKTFAYWMKQARKMAREFQSGVDDMIRHAELDEAKKAVEDARRTLNKEIDKAVDPTGEIKQALKDNPISDSSIKAPTPSVPATPPKPAVAAEPAAAATVAVPAAEPVPAEKSA